MGTAVADSVALTGDARIDGITQGGSWEFSGSQVLTYSFSVNDTEPFSEDWVGREALAAAFQQALAAWAAVANITFEEYGSGTPLTGSPADLGVVVVDDIGSDLVGTGIFPDPEYVDNELLPAIGYDRTSFPNPEGDMQFNVAHPAMDEIAAGGAGFSVLLHEIGHALGLKHPTDDGGNDRPTYAELGIVGPLDDKTVMTGTLAVSGPYAATPLIYDILAIQNIYGANMTYHAGDDLYVLADDGARRALWDAGGNDTLDASARVTSQVIDLRPGAVMGVGASSFGIAFNVTIENAIGTSSGDTIYGNDANNILDGRGGDDSMIGGAGDDIFILDSAADSVDGGLGSDTIAVGFSYGLGAPGHLSVENITLTGSSDISATGDASGNVITGNAGANVLNGGAGADTLSGGLGSDVYIVDNAGDVVTDTGGTDTVRTNLSYGLGADLEQLVLTGSANSQGTGNALNNMLTGNGGNNLLDGGAGSDTLVGFGGDDIYVVDSAGDSVAESMLSTALASTAADGTQADGSSSGAVVSDDGRYVAFDSSAQLVSGSGPWSKIFVKDLQTGNVVLASSTALGPAGNDSSSSADISANGRYVAFESNATNLVAGDTNGWSDVFVKDLQTGAIVRASTDSAGAQGSGPFSGGASISADGRYVAFYSSSALVADDEPATDIFVKDLNTGATVLVSSSSAGTHGNGSSLAADISADGRYVAFSSNSNNLVAGDSNGGQDVFRKDLQTGETILVSSASDGTLADDAANHVMFTLNGSTVGGISADGRYVAFSSLASNLVAGDTNGTVDVFVKDLQTGVTRLVSVAADGGAANGGSNGCGISADGRYVVFNSIATNLAPGDSDAGFDVYVRDLQTNTTVLVTAPASGVKSAQLSLGTSLSGDGGLIAFNSFASNLVAVDNNLQGDVFVSHNPLADPGGVDEVQSTVAFALGSYIERLTLVGSNFIAGTGNELDNVIVGTTGRNVLRGLAGNDSLDGGNDNDKLTGGSGADTLLGGEGDDLFFIDSEDFAPGEIIDGGAGLNDIWYTGTTAATLNLTAGVSHVGTLRIQNEDGQWSGVAPINVDASAVTSNGMLIVGNSGANALVGTGLADIIGGGDGNDTLTGGAGDDALGGGAGDDVYIIASGAHHGADEYLDGDGGDVIRFASTQAGDTLLLSSHISNIPRVEIADAAGVNTGTTPLNVNAAAVVGALTIIGNAGANGLTSTNAADSLIGLGGADTLSGLGGNDTLQGGAGNDSLDGGAGVDTATYQDAVGAVTVNLSIGGAQATGGAGSDTLLNIENLIGGAFNDLLAGDAGNNVLDGGAGSDTASYAGAGSGVNVGLAIAGAQATGGAGTDTLVSIENLVGGAFNDTLAGNGNSNVLTGAAGNDTLDGGGGSDTMVGGAGDDSFLVDVAGDVCSEAANEGTDTVSTSVDYDIQNNIENITLLGVGNIRGGGNSANNAILGNSGNNFLQGRAGNDTLSGADGDDNLDGGAGDDLLDAGAGTDTASYSVAAGAVTLSLAVAGAQITGGAGTDTLVSIENLTGSGFNDSLTGDGNNNALNGAAGNDTLGGGVGDDALDGGTGADVMSGGTGNDAYWVDNALDVCSEAGAAGTDTVKNSVDYDIGNNIENVALLGGGNIRGGGNSLDNVLTGNNGANLLQGRAGNDTIDGGAGVDNMAGGTGNDTYFVDATNDLCSEAVGEGTDAVFSTVGYNINNNIETLTLLGVANIQGGGNASDNTILGNSGNNFLQGRGGNDVLDGGAGADIMVGGTGNDTMYVNQTNDVASESLNEGTDTVYSLANYDIQNNIENLILQGGANLRGGGNTLDNTILGNSGNNFLQGRVGNDTIDGGGGADNMVGGAGNDTYFVNQTSDICTEALNEGTDTVFSLANYDLNNNVENLTLQGGANLNGGGNTLANTINGNGGANLLQGRAGNDTLDGGAGADTLNGGAGADKFVFADVSNDTIQDFELAVDDIVLDNAFFTQLGPDGALDAAKFYSAAGASQGLDGDDYLVYDQASGALYYDADGAGGASGLQLATLVGSPDALTHSDFIVA